MATLASYFILSSIVSQDPFPLRDSPPKDRLRAQIVDVYLNFGWIFFQFLQRKELIPLAEFP
jgi:hypothetical protein